MIKNSTKSAIIADRFAYAEDEEVLVNALDLCNEIIEHEKLRRAYQQIVKRLDLMIAIADERNKPAYGRIDLRA